MTDWRKGTVWDPVPTKITTGISAVCATRGCIQEQYFTSIRELQARIEELESELIETRAQIPSVNNQTL